jgi:hypothetical protein
VDAGRDSEGGLLLIKRLQPHYSRLSPHIPGRNSEDKQTQRVAFTVGENTTNVVETGLYNLTKDEAPCLIHFGTSAPNGGCWCN